MLSREGGVGLCHLMPLSKTFQLYPGSQFYWWRNTTDLPQFTYKLNVVAGIKLTTLVVIGTDCIGCYKITTMTAPILFSKLMFYYFIWPWCSYSCYYISGIMVNTLASSGICCFYTKHPALRGKNEDWLAWNQNNVSGLSNMSSHSGHSTPARHRTNCTSNCIFSTPTVFSKMIMSKWK